MRTDFTLDQLADSDTRESEKILRACVHCGFCTATCPTYVLLGDELDGPRGRIYLIKNMLEDGGPVPAETVTHVDRCLSCLACMTTCPSGVNYMHLVDHGRRHIEQHYRRRPAERLLRRLLGAVLSRPMRFRTALRATSLARPFRAVLPSRLRAMLSLVPARLPLPSLADRPQVFPAEGERRMRVALLPGCAQQVLAPEINEATIRLLTRHGCEVVVAEGSGCCGALPHHLGQQDEALGFARANIDAWSGVLADAELDAIVVNASGCGTMVKDYGFLFREDAGYAAKAAQIAALARDVSEVAAELAITAPAGEGRRLRVAYHSACSLQHGQQLHREPKALLAAAAYEVVDIPEPHLCCGSAGTYNLLQPELATALRDRKLANIARTGADVVAAGNIGCITQLAGEAGVPVVHTVELLDWATGGPIPAGLASAAQSMESADSPPGR
ncbi:MAG: glycolate oxidase subunit GlcF [Alphaproteobacteria bacterium]|nr:glycolate oxidase subunit GlcF [Alphaproteobacteria bacterium]